MIWQSGGRSLLVTGEDEKEDSLGFCALEAEKKGRTCLEVTMERRASGMAYRVFRDVEKISGRAD